MMLFRVLVLILLLPWLAYGVNNHGTPDMSAEIRARSADQLVPFVVSGCIHAVSANTATTIASCAAYTTAGWYVADATSRAITYTGGAGTYWLLVHHSISTAVSGWTRVAGTHYMYMKAAAQPDTPSGAVIALKVIVDSVPSITRVTRVAGTNPTGLGVISITDPAFNLPVDWTADTSAAWQAAITAANGRCIYAPPRVYVIQTGLTYTSPALTYDPGLCIIGAGESQTTFDNQVANDSMLTVDGAGTSAYFQIGMRLQAFGITTSTQPAASHGITVTGVWMGTIKNVCIGDFLCRGTLTANDYGLTGDAIRLDTSDGDGDSPSNILIETSLLNGNGGWGINFVTATGILNLGYIEIRNNIITRNTTGGIRWHGLQGRIIQTGIVANGNTTNGYGGLYVYYDGAGTRNLTVENCQFDANAGQTGYDAHITVDSILGLRILNNNFKYQDVNPPGSFGPSYGIRLGDGTNSVTGVTIDNNQIVSSPSNPSAATTNVYINPVGVVGVLINNMQYPSFSGGNATKYEDTALVAAIYEAGYFLRQRLATQIVSTEGGGTVNPDLTLGMYYRYTVTTGTTIEIGKPAIAARGMELIVDVYNNVANNMQVTWESGAEAYTGIKTWNLSASGGRNTARFIYDTSGGNWVLQGAPAGQGQRYKGSNSSPSMPEIAVNATTAFNITVPGAVVGCAAFASPRPSTPGTPPLFASDAHFVWSAYTTNTDTVRVVVANVDTTAHTPLDKVWDAVVWCN